MKVNGQPVTVSISGPSLRSSSRQILNQKDAQEYDEWLMGPQVGYSIDQVGTEYAMCISLIDSADGVGGLRCGTVHRRRVSRGQENTGVLRPWQ